MLNKTTIKILLLYFSLILLVPGISLAAEAPALTHTLTKIKTPYTTPTLSLRNLDEETIDIRQLKGKVVVVNFWATWCPPCRREMGSLERLYQATKNKNVTVLAVNIGEDVDTVFSFLGMVEPSPEFPIVFDSDAQMMKPWNVKGLPTTYIVDRDGFVAYRAVGGREFDHPDILKAISDLNK